MAASGDPILEEVMTVSVLERIADEPAVVRSVRQCLSNGTLAVLDRIETEMFDRPRSRPEGPVPN
jgi:hypothetical protein